MYKYEAIGIKAQIERGNTESETRRYTREPTVKLILPSTAEWSRWD